MIDNQYNYAYTATAATASIAAGGTITLHSVVIPKATGGTISFQDVTGGVYFAFPAATVGNTYLFDAVLSNGLQIVAGSATDQITTTWKRV